MIGWLRREAHYFACAVVFLTRIPLPLASFPSEDLPRASGYFPAVGLLVGAAAAVVFSLASSWWPQGIAVVLAIGFAMLVTGAFHEDGLADTADGLGGGWTQERKLEIMKDSRIGTYGSCALLVSLLMKVMALTSIDSSLVALTLPVAHLLARWMILPLVLTLPYVSGASGSGASLVNGIPGRRFVAATVFSVLVLYSLSPAYLIAILCTAIVLFLVAKWFLRRQLGGITGDTLGAVNQLTELCVYLLVAARF
ncbi:MAG: adenosylcobinamide-GDP ribazoletransferase [Pseudomonadota bacterium]